MSIRHAPPLGAVACGPYRIVSLMSREAADELDLKPGQTAAAVVKSKIVVIGRP